jgi:predicted RNA binding protein YcfA (HicA-like mRNA interferase family)
MPRLPVVSGRDLIRYLTNKKGFSATGGRGSHVVLKSPDGQHICTVPLHPELDRGTLRKILEQAGIGREQFEREW